MSQTSIEMQFQVLLTKAQAGDQKAALELVRFAFQALSGNGVPQNTQFGLALLKKLSKCGNKTFQNSLVASIVDFAFQISKDQHKLGFELFTLAGKLGDPGAKRNLAVCFFEGQGTQRQPDKVMGLLKESYDAGEQSVLEDMSTMASKFLFGDDGRITPDLQKAVELFTFAAQAGHAVALKNLGLLGVWFYSGISPCPQDIPQGIAILKMAAKLGEEEALHNLEVVATAMITTEPKVGFELFTLASELSNLQAKRNLAVCFLKGLGTERQFDKAIDLFKECYEVGDKSVLEDINAVAIELLSGDNGKITPDLQKAVELLTFAVQAGHAVALKNLSLLGGWFYSGVSPCPQDMSQGIAILKMTAKLGDEKALHNLGAVGAKMLETEPKVGFELLTLADALGNLEAKRNLAVCFLGGTGTERDISKVISLLKACYIAGNPSILDDIRTVAVRVLSGSHGCQKDVALGIKLFAYAAQHGVQDAQNDLRILANHFLAWQKFEADYGIQQDIPKGLRILHYLANTLKDTAANEQLMQIRALKIPVPMPSVPESARKFTCNDLTIGPSTPEEPHSPRTAAFLKRYNISISATGVVMGGSNAVWSAQTIVQFKADRNAQKLEHFTGVFAALNQHFPTASPIQEIVCGYIPNEVSPLFFQYQRALVALDKEPQLECLSMGIEEAPGDSSPVKLQGSCT